MLVMLIGEVVVVTGAVMVNGAVPETPPDVAEIVVVPAAVDVVSPLEPAALLVCATPALDEPQVTDAVRF